jgi:hypothetical protein
MRRSELDPKLVPLLGALFAGAQQVLAIGVTASLPGQDVSVVEDVDSALSLGGAFEAAVWRLSSDTSPVRTGLTVLRSVLAPGARLLLVADRRAPTLDQLRAVLARAPVPRARLESLCEAALLAGLTAPRVHDLGPRWLLLSTSLPHDRTPLDVFFEQPRGQPSR